jgi:hypothetical protein
MARPQKIGLEYFSLDVDIFDDEKVVPISSEFGAKGECVMIRVLCAIYRNGYFAECSEAFKFKIAKQANVSHSLVSEVISGLVKWGFFDKTVFDSFGILTSNGIQKRWKEATRKRVPQNDLDFWISEFPAQKQVFPAEETPLNQSESTQIKRKEIKLKKEKTKKEKPPSSFPEIDFKKLVDTFHKLCPTMPQVRELTEARKNAVRLRVKEFGKEQVLEVIQKAGSSKFLNGDNERGFKASFDFIFTASKFVKILEGNYDERKLSKPEKIKPVRRLDNESDFGMSPDYEKYKQKINELTEKKKVEA